MVAEEHLQGGFAGLGDLRGLGGDDHAFGYRGGTGSLKLRHLLDTHDAHTASSLERETGIVAESRDLDAGGLAGLNEEGACGSGELFAVYGEFNVCHFDLLSYSSLYGFKSRQANGLELQ
jgi:hypothetical protein